ncbi:hypothetical protein KKG52_03145 [Patescibacteria group bacterium]|nr:hypothetical protein [Patescibacteria group bacterium]
MRRKKGNFFFLILAVTLLLGITYLINTFDPNSFLPIDIVNVSPIPIFIISISFFIFFLTMFFFKNKRRAFFAAFLITSYLLLAIFGLKHPFFIILIASFLIVLDRFFSRR